MKNWFLESNRYKHFILAIPIRFIFTILCVLGCASVMEFKDVHHHNGNKPMREWNWKSFDWLDWISTMIGGLIGQALQIMLILFIFH